MTDLSLPLCSSLTAPVIFVEQGVGPWITPVAVVACVTLAWNLLNTFYTRWLDRTYKDRDIKLDVFRSNIRPPIDEAIADLRKVTRCLARLHLPPTSASAISDLSRELIELNREMNLAVVSLGEALGEADTSKFAQNNDWMDGFDEREEAIADAFNDTFQAHADENWSSLGTAVEAARTHLDDLRASVSGRVEHEIHGYVSADETFLQHCAKSLKDTGSRWICGARNHINRRNVS